MFVNKHAQDVIFVILSVCYVDHLLCHDFQGQTDLVFGEKRKWEKLTKRKGKEQKRQNRRSDDTQRTGVPKTPKKEKVVATLQD